MGYLTGNWLPNFGWLTMPIIFVLAIWSIYWKGMALWKASKKDDWWWFVVLMVVNTIGILEILYIYVFSKRMKK
jgi:hypothetical protein